MMIFLLSLVFAVQTGAINIAKVDGVIHPASAGYLVRAIQQSESDKAECLIIEMDTPGGLDESMRNITKAILNAKIPVVVYVHPSGARCASAGVFILLSAPITAMTPGTNIGAAHPVGVGGTMADDSRTKAENDAVAYIKSIANKRGKNEGWAENAVRKSVSITAEEALKDTVIDYVVANVTELLDSINGKIVNLESGEVILNTKNKVIKEIKWGFSENFLSHIAHPNFAYILMMLGIWGLILEFSHPGAVLPGVLGGISLIMAFYAFQIIPINYAGLGLILLGFALLILELFIPTSGPLTIGGVISMLLGSMMLIKVKTSFWSISWVSILVVIGSITAFFVFVLSAAVRAMKKKPVTGKHGLIGQIGKVKEKIVPGKEGKVFIVGEWWNATADETIEAGESVKILNVEGLVLKVGKEH
ncbi:MAG: nodulation protein NfeD [bacterium]|nr:nodulation protein NfeD [bacterium]